MQSTRGGASLDIDIHIDANLHVPEGPMMTINYSFSVWAVEQAVHVRDVGRVPVLDVAVQVPEILDLGVNRCGRHEEARPTREPTDAKLPSYPTCSMNGRCDARGP